MGQRRVICVTKPGSDGHHNRGSAHARAPRLPQTAPEPTMPRQPAPLPRSARRIALLSLAALSLPAAAQAVSVAPAPS